MKLPARRLSPARDTEELEASEGPVPTPATRPAGRRAANAGVETSEDSASASAESEDEEEEEEDDDGEEADDPALQTLPAKRLGELLTSEVCRLFLVQFACRSLSAEAPRIVGSKKEAHAAWNRDADTPRVAGESRRQSQSSSAGTLSSRSRSSLPSAHSSTRNSSLDPAQDSETDEELDAQLERDSQRRKHRSQAKVSDNPSSIGMLIHLLVAALHCTGGKIS